jgi:hypothetical protein
MEVSSLVAILGPPNIHIHPVLFTEHSNLNLSLSLARLSGIHDCGAIQPVIA